MEKAAERARVARRPELGRRGSVPELENAAVAAAEAAEARAWDAPRVARHIERALVQAYRAYRRAHWFSLLHDSDVVYREPGAARTRLLELRAGEVVAARDASFEYVPSARVCRVSARRAPFDRNEYDRLRVLTTELKRIVRDGGSVALHWGPARRLPERWLNGVLASS